MEGIFKSCPDKDRCGGESMEFVLKCYASFGHCISGVAGARADCAAARRIALGLNKPVKSPVPEGFCARRDI